MQQLLDQLEQRRMLDPAAPRQVQALEASQGGRRERLMVLENGKPKFFVKLAAVEEDAASLKREFDALVLVRRFHRETSLIHNLPNPLYFSRTEGQWALVLGALPGQADENAFFPGGLGLLRRMRGMAFLRVLPEVLVRLHQPLRVNGKAAEVVPPPGLSARALALVQQSVERMEQNPGPVGGTHGDFGPMNLIKTKDMAWFIDWEDYQKHGQQIHDLFSLFTTAARGPRAALAASSQNARAVADKSANQTAWWLYRGGGFQKLFLSGLRIYAKNTGFDEAWLASAYPAFLASRFWQQSMKDGHDSPQALEWLLLLEYLAVARPSLLNHF